MTSPTQRTLAWCRRQGGDAAVTEHWNPHAHIRQDMFGFCDVLWVCPAGIHHYIQCTSDSNVSVRVKKILRKAIARRLTKHQHVCIEVHGWRKSGPRGKPKRWNVRIVYPFP
jgi:hypothetical protein